MGAEHTRIKRIKKLKDTIQLHPEGLRFNHLYSLIGEEFGIRPVKLIEYIISLHDTGFLIINKIKDNSYYGGYYVYRSRTPNDPPFDLEDIGVYDSYSISGCK